MRLPSTDQEMAFHVNRHGVLAVPAIFWCALGFLARYWLLLFMVGLSSRRDAGSSQLLLGTGGLSWAMLIGQSLVLLIATVTFQRQPTGRAWARWLWAKTPTLIALVACCNALWIGPLLVQPSNWQWNADLLLASCSLVDAAIVVAVLREPYYRKMFAEFPQIDSR